MRTIKFRGYSEELKCFVYGFYLEVGLEGVRYSYIFWQGNTTTVRSDSVAQFTGLTDKNGKEIFEGDVVNFGNNDIHHIVAYVGNSFVLAFTYGKIAVYNWTGVNLEIIGSIYENPELLKSNQYEN